MYAGLYDFMSAVGCIQRIETYLKSTARVDRRTIMEGTKLETALESSLKADSISISVHNGSFGWSNKAQLHKINLNIRAGEFTFLLGPVASGKSTLLKALLGETPFFEGSVTISSAEIAFCEQSAWLMNTSIHSNITGFSPFDRNLYLTVTHACDLQPDFASLARGDETVVGSKGFALSGGQKQRIVKQCR